MDIILNGVTDCKSINNATYTGSGTLVNGLQHGNWDYGYVCTSDPTNFHLITLHSIEYDRGQVIRTKVTTREAIIMTEYLDQKEISISSIDLANPTVCDFTLVSYYSDIDSKLGIQSKETFRYSLTEKSKQPKSQMPNQLRESYICYSNGDFKKTVYNKNGNKRSAIGKINGQALKKTYIHDLYYLNNNTNAQGVIFRFQSIFKDLLVEHTVNQKDIVSCDYDRNSLTVTTRKEADNGYIKTVKKYCFVNLQTQTEERFFYDNKRLGITKTSMTKFGENEPYKSHEYFAIGNRRVDMKESPVTCNSQIDKSLATYYVLKYK